MELITAVLGLLLAVIVIIKLIQHVWGRRNHLLNEIPGPPSLPIIGNIHEMFQVEAVELFLKWCETYGKVLKYEVFMLGTQVMVSDADIIHNILVTNSHCYKKPESLLKPVRKIFGSRCVISLSREEHAKRRRILNPAFNTASIRNKARSIQENTNRLIGTWNSDIIKIQDDLTRLSLDILGDCVFGYNFDCIENPEQELTAALYRIMSVQDMSILRMLPFYDYLPTRLNRDLKLIRYHVQNIISHKQITITGEERVDMLDLMLQSRNIEGVGSLSDQDIIDDVILFLIAGHETATNVMCWVILELARNPHIQNKCRQEVDKVLQEFSSLNYTSASRLVYIENCLKEVLRLYPPVPLTARENIFDTNLGQYRIPKGTVIAIQIAATMRQPDYYTDPLVFRPERFTDDDIQSHHFIPFLAGPDVCIGSKFAMLEMKLIIANILSQTELSLVEGTEDMFKGSQGLTYHIKPKLFVRAERIL